MKHMGIARSNLCMKKVDDQEEISINQTEYIQGNLKIFKMVDLPETSIIIEWNTDHHPQRLIYHRTGWDWMSIYDGTMVKPERECSGKGLYSKTLNQPFLFGHGSLKCQSLSTGLHWTKRLFWYSIEGIFHGLFHLFQVIVV